MSSVGNSGEASDGTNDEIKKYYSMKKIYRFERIFGPTWVSVGSETMAKEFFLRLNLKPGQKVLDIGCGTGGPVYHMARKFGCVVHGIDLSQDMISLCKDRLNWEEKVVRNRVTFETGDISKLTFPDNEFDVIHSRNVLLYITDKKSLFSRIQPWLKPGGKLLIADYVKGKSELSSDFAKHLENRNFHLHTFSEYQNTLRNAGFRVIETEDLTDKFVKISEAELQYFYTSKEAFVADFSPEDFDWVVNDWQSKVRPAKVGELLWGLFICTK